MPDMEEDRKVELLADDSGGVKAPDDAAGDSEGDRGWRGLSERTWRSVIVLEDLSKEYSGERGNCGPEPWRSAASAETCAADCEDGSVFGKESYGCLGRLRKVQQDRVFFLSVFLSFFCGNDGNNGHHTHRLLQRCRSESVKGGTRWMWLKKRWGTTRRNMELEYET